MGGLDAVQVLVLKTKGHVSVDNVMRGASTWWERADNDVADKKANNRRLMLPADTAATQRVERSTGLVRFCGEVLGKMCYPISWRGLAGHDQTRRVAQWLAHARRVEREGGQ